MSAAEDTDGARPGDKMRAIGPRNFISRRAEQVLGNVVFTEPDDWRAALGANKISRHPSYSLLLTGDSAAGRRWRR